MGGASWVWVGGAWRCSGWTRHESVLNGLAAGVAGEWGGLSASLVLLAGDTSSCHPLPPTPSPRRDEDQGVSWALEAKEGPHPTVNSPRKPSLIPTLGQVPLLYLPEPPKLSAHDYTLRRTFCAVPPPPAGWVTSYWNPPQSSLGFATEVLEDSGMDEVQGNFI